MRAMGVRRDNVFSPNSVEKDRAILLAVLRILADRGWDTVLVDELQLCADDRADCYLSMARSPQALCVLGGLEREGRRMFNQPEGVANCQRSRLDTIMRQNRIPMPPKESAHGWWLKRGDAAAQTKADVVFCPDSEALAAARRDFLRRGITDFVVSAHVVGDLVKFYGVSNGFFRYFYPTDDGQSKFGDERRNGMAHHYPFSCESLQADVERLSHLAGVDVYGGDAIVDEYGHYFIIDFNDWPSFSRCREEAAGAIAQLAQQK